MPRIRTHPGEVLRKEFLVPLGMSASALGRAVGVPPNRITALIAEQRDATADTAIRLARALDTDPQFWLNLQTAHDLSKAEAERAKTYAAIASVLPSA